MPTLSKFNDVETTYELKTYELTLACGKCNGQLIAADTTSETNQTLHVCTGCGREQLTTGPGYPRTETRKVATERFIERTEEIPDELPRDYYPDYYKDKEAIAELPWGQQLDLLRTTTQPVMIDHLELASSWELHRHTDMRRELFDMAKQAATHRAETMPKEIDDKPLAAQEHYDLSIVKAVELISKTHYPEDVAKIQEILEGRLINLPELRKALYAIARHLVSLRNQPVLA